MKKTYHIEGMHCKACELLVKKSCECIGGCTIEQINHKTGSLHIDRHDSTINEQELQKSIEHCGYHIRDTAPQKKIKNTPIPLTHRLVFILVALTLTFILIKVDVLGFMTNMQTGTGLGMIVLLGLIASVSTCLAVTGGVVIGFTELIDKSSGVWGHIKLHTSFQGGRLIGFFAFGALLGWLGQSISIGLGFSSWFNALIAIVFIYIGLQLLGFMPSLSSFGIHLPDKRTKHILSQRNPYLAPVVGALTFFLPCGFTQSVQLMALASGNWLGGGMMMLVFALGTLPGLLALGMGTSFAKDQRKQGFEQVIAVILLVFGMFTFWGSARLRGRTDKMNTSGTTVTTQQVQVPVSIQKITLSHDGLQLVPETTTLQAGGNYEITITPTQNGLGCMSTITFPRIDNSVKQIIQGQPIIYTIENAQPGQFSFVCGSMGMSQGKIIVQ